MLRVVLSRDNLMCGFDNGVDPTNDQSLIRTPSRGSRPNWFFGPRRDALSLLVRHMESLIVLKPKQLSDLDTQLVVLSLPGISHKLINRWIEKSKSLIGDHYKIAWLSMNESHSHLEPDGDIYRQTFELDQQDSEGFQSQVIKNIEGITLQSECFIEKNTLREQWQISGLEEDAFELWVINWHKPEIEASSMMQSTALIESMGSICSWRGDSFFSVRGLQNEETAPLAFVDCGWNQQGNHAADRLGDILQACISEDRTLGFHYVGHLEKKCWLGVEPRTTQALGETDGLIVWKWQPKKAFETRYHLTRSLDELESLAFAPFTEAKELIHQADREWISKQKKAPNHTNQKIRDLYNRTLLTLRQMQDPDGGIIAAPEFHYALSHCGGYGYCWGRDAGFITLAMDLCGMHEESARFYRYMEKCQSEDGSFLHRHDMNGNLGSSWGFLQPDETGSVVFGLWKHLELSHNKGLMQELQPMIVSACNWLAESRNKDNPELPISGFDLWEEREGVHIYAIAAMAAGLDAGIKIAKTMDWETPKEWQERLDEYRSLINSSLFIHKMPNDASDSDQTLAFARTLHRRISNEHAVNLRAKGYDVKTHTDAHGRMTSTLSEDFVLDISQVGVHYPYEVLDEEKYGSEFNHLLDLLSTKLWRPGVGGIGRYEADHYRDGNPWILSTLWLALSAARSSKFEIAKKCWNWVVNHASQEGLFPEQIDPLTGHAAWVMPLTWSHAMFALAVHELPEEITK